MGYVNDKLASATCVLDARFWTLIGAGFAGDEIARLVEISARARKAGL